MTTYVFATFLLFSWLGIGALSQKRPLLPKEAALIFGLFVFIGWSGWLLVMS